mgnify:CR=1 FL=1
MAAGRAQRSRYTRLAEAKHADQLSELRAEAANYRIQSEAQVAHIVADLKAQGEARHAEAMSAASAGFAAKAAALEAQ